MKSDNASELVKAVKNLNEGKGHYSATFVRLLNGLKLQPGRLSEREQQVIDLTAKGLSTSDMAAQLGISANTVEFHRRRIMQKLNVANAAQRRRRAGAHQRQPPLCGLYGRRLHHHEPSDRGRVPQLPQRDPRRQPHPRDHRHQGIHRDHRACFADYYRAFKKSSPHLLYRG